MVVLITGSDGFIGRHLVDAYLRQNATVYGWTLDGVGEIGKICKKANLLNMEEVSEQIKQITPDLLIHCAGCADVLLSVREPMLDLESNYITTHNILFTMKELGMYSCRFVLLSSAAVYGNPEKLPMDESASINPLSPYALHKKAAEDVCYFVNKNYGIDAKVMRIFSVYGPGLRKQLFWDMYKKIRDTGELKLFGSGEESRDYIYIDDLVQATMLIASVETKEIIFNVANGIEVTIREAAELFVKTTGEKLDIIHFMGQRRDGEPINWRADISKLLELGYERKVTFEDGIKQYVRWLAEL